MTGYYLLDHQNPNAPIRDDGRRFWGYSSRRRAPRLIVIHTAENLPDLDPPDHGAESVAKYGATTDRAASWHVVCDSDSIIPCLPDHYTAFHVQSYNSEGLGLEIATRAASWAQVPDRWKGSILHNAAEVCRGWMDAFGIPAIRLTKAEADASQKGFIDHARLDPTRRSDPGRDFPWDTLLALCKGHGKEERMFNIQHGDKAYSFTDVLVHEATGGFYALRPDGGIFTFGPAPNTPEPPFFGSYPKGVEEGWKAIKLEPYKGGYMFLNDRGQTYHFPDPNYSPPSGGGSSVDERAIADRVAADIQRRLES